MKNVITMKTLADDLFSTSSIHQALESIEQKLDEEVLAKQKTIERQEEEIRRLHELVEEKNKMILNAEEKLLDTVRTSEGNRQLINKLLGDIDRLNLDVEWYKRTYEKRSLLGLVKHKLKYFFSK